MLPRELQEQHVLDLLLLQNNSFWTSEIQWFVWYTQEEIAAVKYEMSHFQSLTSTVILSHDSSVMDSRLVVLRAVEVVVTKLVAQWLSVCFV